MMRRPAAGLLASLATVWLSVCLRAATSAAAVPAKGDWQVASVVRNIDLGGSVSVVNDVHTVRPPPGSAEPTSDDRVPSYYFAFSQADASKMSGLEATARFGVGLKPEQRRILPVKDEGLLDAVIGGEGGAASAGASVFPHNANASDTRPHLYSVQLPAAFLRKAHPSEPLPDTTITISALMLHASEAIPKHVGQSETQYLVWHGDASVMSPYGIDSARVKAKSPQPKILSYSVEPALEADQVVKSGSTITFGPLKGVRSLLSLQAHEKELPRARIHYQYNLPMLTLVDSKRDATISHWRNRVKVHDDYWLRSDGATLKGHFSRIEHQMNLMSKRDASHVISGLSMNLPPGAEGAYFVDESGNVSTSHFRPAPPSPQQVGTPAHLLSGAKASVLQIQPRYPLLGGWNYTCSVGWSVRLSDGWHKVLSDKAAGRYATQVPFMTSLKDVAVDSATLRIVLPEGASDVAVQAPFAVDAESRSTSWSFLDTTGKPVVELRKAKCGDRHGGLVTVEYTLTPLDHYRKVAVAALLLVLGALTVHFGSRVDLSIKA